MKNLLTFVVLGIVFALGSFSLAACDDDGVAVCSDGNCTCDQGATGCDFHCKDGGCAQNCEPNSTCVVKCEGGNCDQTCVTTATSCSFECSGGGCNQVCAQNPNCTLSCTGNNCTDDKVVIPWP